MSKNSKGPTKRAMIDLEAVPAPIEPLEALRRNLLHAMLRGVSEDDMEAIVRVQVRRARNGEEKAARLVIDMLQAGLATPCAEPASPDVYVNQTVLNVASNSVCSVQDRRESIVHLLAQSGPQSPIAIQEHITCSLAQVNEALNHPWFEREADGWHLTAKARAEVLDQDE